MKKSEQKYPSDYGEVTEAEYWQKRDDDGDLHDHNLEKE